MPARNLKLYEKKKKNRDQGLEEKRTGKIQGFFFFFFDPNEKESQVKLKIISEG